MLQEHKWRSPSLGLPRHRIQDRAAGVDVHRVAELVQLRRAAGFDAGGHLARVVPAEAALADRPEQVAQRPIAEEVEALVGDLELEVGLGSASAAPRPIALGPLGVEIGRARQVALMLQLLDDLLDQLLDPLLRIVGGLPVLAEQLLEHLVGQQPAVQQRLEDGVVQRLRRHALPRRRRRAVRVVEAALEQQVRQLRQQLFEVEPVEVLAVNLE